jgi:hypothetical protein
MHSMSTLLVERTGKIDATRKRAEFANRQVLPALLGLPFGERNVEFVMRTAKAGRHWRHWHKLSKVTTSRDP